MALNHKKSNIEAQDMDVQSKSITAKNKFSDLVWTVSLETIMQNRPGVR